MSHATFHSKEYHRFSGLDLGLGASGSVLTTTAQMLTLYDWHHMPLRMRQRARVAKTATELAGKVDINTINYSRE